MIQANINHTAIRGKDEPDKCAEVDLDGPYMLRYEAWLNKLSRHLTLRQLTI